jgi:hypothetical protein
MAAEPPPVMALREPFVGDARPVAARTSSMRAPATGEEGGTPVWREITR